jgi:hypothetical protein
VKVCKLLPARNDPECLLNPAAGQMIRMPLSISNWNGMYSSTIRIQRGNGCFTSEVLRSVVYEPETLDLQDPKYQHIMECAECLREVIEFREARLAQTSLRPQDLSKGSQM